MSHTDLTRETVLEEIRFLAGRLGRTPSKKTFEAETGIGEGRWTRWWSRWTDAVTEAGLAPNRPTPRADDAAALRQLAALALRLERVPSRADVRVARRAGEDVPGEKVAKRLIEGRTLAGRLRTLVDEVDGLEQLLPTPMHALADESRPVSGYVYLVRSGDMHKIGATTNILRREGELQLHVPGGIEPIHYLETDDPFGIEAYWHRRFEDRRENGEWFRLTSDDVAAFVSRGRSM